MLPVGPTGLRTSLSASHVAGGDFQVRDRVSIRVASSGGSAHGGVACLGRARDGPPAGCIRLWRRLSLDLVDVSRASRQSSRASH